MSTYLDELEELDIQWRQFKADMKSCFTETKAMRFLLNFCPLQYEHTFRNGEHTIQAFKMLLWTRHNIGPPYLGPPEHYNCQCTGKRYEGITYLEDLLPRERMGR